jgi:hypothetical protein
MAWRCACIHDKSFRELAAPMCMHTLCETAEGSNNTQGPAQVDPLGSTWYRRQYILLGIASEYLDGDCYLGRASTHSSRRQHALAITLNHVRRNKPRPLNNESSPIYCQLRTLNDWNYLFSRSAPNRGGIGLVFASSISHYQNLDRLALLEWACLSFWCLVITIGSLSTTQIYPTHLGKEYSLSCT